MPGTIQSIERAAAVLKVLAGAGRPLELAEIAESLALPKPTVFGIVRTLREVGFVAQEDGTAYRLGPAVQDLTDGAVDAHDLRSHATNWADSLAAHTRLEVHVGMPVAGGALLVHHVYRPDDTNQVLRVGEVHPLHATALGKAVLAFTPGTAQRLRAVPLDRFTRRTVTTRPGLEAEVRRARAHGFASARGEFAPDVAGVAAPIRGLGGLGVGAIAAVGPLDLVMDSQGIARPAVVERTVAAAFAITRAIGLPR
ncbi:MAG: IclR family transcriptional regulator [Mycobacteriales bacterium]